MTIMYINLIIYNYLIELYRGQLFDIRPGPGMENFISGPGAGAGAGECRIKCKLSNQEFCKYKYIN